MTTFAMQLAIILTTILETFATSPDLCAEVHVDASGEPYTDFAGRALSRHCQWTGPEAPVLDAEVKDTCWRATTGSSTTTARSIASINERRP